MNPKKNLVLILLSAVAFVLVFVQTLSQNKDDDSGILYDLNVANADIVSSGESGGESSSGESSGEAGAGEAGAGEGCGGSESGESSGK